MMEPYVPFFETGRDLVSTASNYERVVPDLDGNLYLKRTMKILPLTIDDILQAPVRTCVEDDVSHETECGIVTGTKLTSLYGMDASSGKLVWSTHSSNTPSSSSTSSTIDVVVLQREDYIVQHISTATGHQVWNVTLGRFSALDFESATDSLLQSSQAEPPLMIDDDGIEDDEDENDDETTLTDDDDDDDDTVSSISSLPLIAFDGLGRVLTVLDQETNQVRWRRQFPKVIARVYGLHKGLWVPLTVVEEPMLMEEEEETQQLLLPASSTNQNDEIYQLLLQQQFMQTNKWQDKSLGVYTPPLIPVRTGPNKPAGDVCVPSSLIGIPTVQPPIASIPVFPPAPPLQAATSSGGLFLTWPILAAILFTAIAIAVGLFLIYLNKRQKWMSQATALTPVISHRKAPTGKSPPRLELDRKTSAPLGETPSHQSRTANFKRSMSLPVFTGDNNKSIEQHKDDSDKSSPSLFSEDSPSMPHQQQQSFNTSTATTTTPSTTVIHHQLTQLSPMLKPQPGDLEGIPLVRYSRYRSEFEELEPLGKGGFGSVFECKNLLDGRKYAIKKVPIQLFDDPQMTRDQLQRVLREVKILALLDHPNIVRYYTAWMEVEENTDEDNNVGGDNDDDYTSSKFLSRCFSSSLLTSNMAAADNERLSQMGNNKPTPKKKENPLGWNSFSNDFSQPSLEKRDSVESLGDYGFQFERTNNDDNDTSKTHSTNKPRKTVKFQMLERNDSVSFSSDSDDEKKVETTSASSKIDNTKSTEPKMRHILYIQMQLCGQKTLSNFLSSPKARKTPDGTGIDVHYALKLFHHVAKGVKYVHSQDLIHRDLKPNNCFMDDSGIVKVGDFGLSRETNNDMDDSFCDDSAGSLDDGDDDEGEENTAGVGTRAYASPEQINGSDYDNSTDIYSLGFILFELTFQMSTGMERHIMFSRLRQRDVPDEWRASVAGSFPILDKMLSDMLSPKPSERPTADEIVRMMEKLLGEFTVQSLDQSLHEQSTMLLRVEAEQSDGVLSRTIQLIKDAAFGVKIDQYGLRSGDKKTIIEFALSGTDQAGLHKVLAAMTACPEIMAARQV